jgi:hypothetical protein
MQYSNTSSVPLSLAVFFATDHYDHNSDPYTISATTIIKPIRQIVLPHRIPTEGMVVDLTDQISSRLGTAIHTGIEMAWKENYRNAMQALGYNKRIIDMVRINPSPEEALNPDIIPIYMEQRLSKQVGKWTVTGKYDFIGQGRLEDFKNTTAFVVMTGINEDKFKMQGSIYRWIDPQIITNPNMAIQYIITDWKAQEARNNPAYPQQRFKELILPLKPINEMEYYVKSKLNDIEKYWDAPEDQVPFCTEEELQRSDPVYKFYKNGFEGAKKSTKNFDSKQDAYIHMSKIGSGEVKEFPAQVKACKFCPAFAACSQKDQLIASGDLTL